MTQDNINSFKDAEDFLLSQFGEPDYFSRPEDITEVQEYLSSFEEELHSLENRVQRMSFDNLNQYILNRMISLHFLIKAGDKYLEKLHNVVYNNKFEELLEKVPYDTYEDNDKYYGTSDEWDRP